MSLTLGVGDGSAYHVVHGPAIISDRFRGEAGQVVTLNWYGLVLPNKDDFAVVGYLLDTDANNDGTASGGAGDCATYPILETTGSTVTAWQFAEVTIPATKEFYKFVFIGGTFDKIG